MCAQLCPSISSLALFFGLSCDYVEVTDLRLPHRQRRQSHTRTHTHTRIDSLTTVCVTCICLKVNKKASALCDLRPLFAACFSFSVFHLLQHIHLIKVFLVLQSCFSIVVATVVSPRDNASSSSPCFGFRFFPQSRICNLYLIRGALSVSFPRISSPVVCAWPGLGRSILSHYQGALILVFITALGVLAQI